jgi:acetylornithine deacetylase
MIAEECTLLISYRPLPRTDSTEVYNEIVRRVQSVDTRDYGSDLRPTIEVGEPFIAPALLSPRHTPLEEVLFAEFSATTSGGAPFSTDGCQFARTGIDSLICGPGDLDQAHQPNESIGRAAFENGTTHILSVIRNMCGS